MKALSNLFVKRRFLFAAIMLVLTVVCAVLLPQVNVNYDMARYLPDDSPMKQGMEKMEKEFPNDAQQATVRVMFRNLPDAQTEQVRARLSALSNADSVAYAPDSADYNADGRTLFVVGTAFDYNTPEELALEQAIADEFSDYDIEVQSGSTEYTQLPLWILLAAFAVVLAILFLMCTSWIEPLLFLVSIGAAILLNLGSNALFESVSGTTLSIAAILQLILSIDYSIILVNRYKRERELTEHAAEAMHNAIRGSFTSIASSALTTIVGLLALVFMRFKIGQDMGLVFAKGVVCSLLCNFTVLPCLVIAADKLLRKTAKKQLRLPTKRLSSYSYRLRKGIVCVFLVLFVGSCVTQGLTGIAYSLRPDDPIAEVFPASEETVLLYDNSEDAAAGQVLAALQAEAGVKSVVSYHAFTTPYSAQELSALLQAQAGVSVDPALLQTLFGTPGTKMSLEEVLTYLRSGALDDPQLSSLLPETLREQLSTAAAQLTAAMAQLRGATVSRAIITTLVSDDTAQSTAFLKRLTAQCDAAFSEPYSLIGNSAMSYEMQQSFGRELNWITALTAVAIFLIVALTFRAFVLPLMIVLLIQCGVFLTVSIAGIGGGSLHYLAILIVECILMGATVDYAILFTHEYRHNRETAEPREALALTYQNCVGTILTSGLVMVITAFLVGFCFAEPTVGQICRTLSLGVLMAMLLILFVLPGMLAAFDRMSLKHWRRRTSES